jgi:hypothetical protein
MRTILDAEVDDMVGEKNLTRRARHVALYIGQEGRKEGRMY